MGTITLRSIGSAALITLIAAFFALVIVGGLWAAVLFTALASRCPA